MLDTVCKYFYVYDVQVLVRETQTSFQGQCVQQNTRDKTVRNWKFISRHRVLIRIVSMFICVPQREEMAVRNEPCKCRVASPHDLHRYGLFLVAVVEGLAALPVRLPGEARTRLRWRGDPRPVFLRLGRLLPKTLG